MRPPAGVFVADSAVPAGLVVTLACILLFFFFFNDTATPEIYPLPLHAPLPIWGMVGPRTAPVLPAARCTCTTRAGTSRSRSEEHTSELQSRGLISYAVFCL